MKNLESIIRQIKKMEVINHDLKLQMQETIQQINHCTEFSYADIENVKRLNRLLSEYLEQYSNNMTSINSMLWTIKEFKKDGE